jgi:uncharacterized protein (DUF433 family)
MRYGPISFDNSAQGGKPVFTGTNVTIQTLFEYLEDGKSAAKFLNDYPAVNKKAVTELLQVAKLFVTTEKTVKENFPVA